MDFSKMKQIKSKEIKVDILQALPCAKCGYKPFLKSDEEDGHRLQCSNYHCGVYNKSRTSWFKDGRDIDAIIKQWNEIQNKDAK